MHPRFSNLVFATAALIALGAAPAAGGPEGGTVAGGAATIQGQGGPAVTVNQSSSSAIINWNTFNIGAKESVRFNQPGSSSVMLNRVTGGLGPSEILGTLTANGRVFIINRDGILFGSGAVINTAGFLATTNDIKNSDFMAGRYNFNIPGRPDASIVNQGRITATSGGFAALVAPGVRNSGTISATLGTVALASGNSFTLDMYGDKLVTLAVNDSIASKVIDVATGRPLKSLVANEGKIRANGGRVELTAAAARVVVDSVINTSGVIKANSIGHRNGMIVLSAATGGSKPAGAPAQTIKISGTLSAAGKKKGTQGGTIVVSGEHIKLTSARVDASGRAGGGKVLIGGDWGGGKPITSLVSNSSAKLESFAIPTATTVSVDAGTTINASASGRGNGGKVVLWSDSETTFAGTILARGGARGGDGGFVEVSSHDVLNYRGTTDTRAPRGATGTLLLDPYNVLISNSPSPDQINNGTFTPTHNDSVLYAGDLSRALETSNIIVTTGGAGSAGNQVGDITVQRGVNVTWSGRATLTLSAYHDINIEAGAVIQNQANSFGSGALVLRADNSGTGSGKVNFQSDSPNCEICLPPGRVDFSQSSGTVSIFFNPSVNPAGSGVNSTSYFNPTEIAIYSAHVAGNLATYMLVNTPYDLQNIRNNQSGAYALGRDILNVNSSIPNFSPIPNFTGVFDGQGQTIANLTIAPNDTTTQNIGLFGTIGSNGVVRNLNLANVSVTANPMIMVPQWVGTLAGTNAGTISNVSVAGQINGTGAPAVVIAGGLVGANEMQSPSLAGSIAQSSANVAVTVGDGDTAGGLVGFNLAGSTITDSYAQGNVIAGNFGRSGGLAGHNATGSTITNSYAQGSITAGNTGSAGGLAGENLGTIVGTIVPALNQACGAGQTCATGVISVGANGTAGGLVAVNGGTITNAFATGAVNGAAGTGGGITTLGGLAGDNQATITNSHARGAVGNSLAANLHAGGLVGENSGAIESSAAVIGSVRAGDASSAGGLVGQNLGSIANSYADREVSVGSSAWAGGLVGSNGYSLTSGATGEIVNSYATGNVTSAGVNVGLGGLVGFNSPASRIGDSYATGNVSSPAAIVQNGPNCAASSSCQIASVGGLVGQNFGEIISSHAGGNVSVGPNGTGGGLVGLNTGIIENAFAIGSVTGASGSGGVNSQGGTTTLGGLAGINQGLISDSSASGNVGNANVANLQAGGLVGDNSGTILSSTATGNVQAGSGSNAGGLVGSNSSSNNLNCASCMNADGAPYFNTALIADAQASGNVSVGAGSLAGGFAGVGDGIIVLGSATGAVTGGGNSILGGFIGALTHASPGFIIFSTSSGPVTSTGANSIVGGFVGLNGGTILGSSTSSAVTGTSESYLGGFAGVNLGTIEFSSATGSVTGTGNHDIIGSFVGANFGSIDSSSAAGNATGATNSAVGGFAGANAQFINFPAGSIPDSSFPVGTITNSSATGTASGGQGSTVDPFIALNDPNSASNPPAFPSIIAGCSDPLCGFLNTGTLPPSVAPPAPPAPPPEPVPAVPAPFSPFLGEVVASQTSAQQFINNLVGNGPAQLAALNTAPVFSTPPGGGARVPPQQQQPSPAPGAQNLPPGFPQRIIDIPPLTETSLIKDEAVVHIATATVTVERLRAAVAPLGLEIVASENIAITGSTAVRLRFTDGRTVQDVIRALAAIQFVAVAQPQYAYRTQQQGSETAPASRGDDTGPKGDAAQYILEKLKISDVHRMVRGTNVTIAVIDSQIDAAHPDLEGVIAERFSAVGAPEKPHAHGTGMAGAIASHQRLLGTAPGARLLAVHAFSTAAAAAESTTFNILKGIDWSVRQGARIINMSFAGPKDPSRSPPPAMPGRNLRRSIPAPIPT